MKYEQVLKQIQALNAVAISLSSSLYNDHPWIKLLNQLLNPDSFRPIRFIDETVVDRTRRFNLKTGHWENVTRKPQRGMTKPTQFTKKLPVSLLPRDGKMELFKPFNSEDNTCILFDLSLCNLKNEKYIFSHDMKTNSKWWLKLRNIHEDKHHLNKSMSLQELRNELDRAPAKEYNELLIGLSKKAVLAVAAMKNTLFDRLNALRIAHVINEKLGVKLPVLVMSRNLGIIEYDITQQHFDRHAALQLIHDTRTLKLLQRLTIVPVPKDLASDDILIRLRVLKDPQELMHLIATHPNLTVTFNQAVVGVRTIQIQKSKIKKYNLGYWDGELIENSWLPLKDTAGRPLRDTAGRSRYYSEEVEETVHFTVDEQLPITLYNASDLLKPMLLLDKRLMTTIMTTYPNQLAALIENCLAITRFYYLDASVQYYIPYHNAYNALSMLANIVVLNGSKINGLSPQNERDWLCYIGDAQGTIQKSEHQDKIEVQKYFVLQTMIAQIEKRKVPFKVFSILSLGGTRSGFFNQQRVPDGIHQIVSVWNDVSVARKNKITQIEGILDKKCQPLSFWQKQRDPELNAFYVEHARKLGGM